MRKTVLLLAVLASALAALAYAQSNRSADTDRHGVAGETLFVFAGQSNMTGQGSVGRPPPANITGLHAQIWIPVKGRQLVSGSFQPYDPPHNSNYPAQTTTDPQFWGSEGEFARRWLADHPGRTFYMIKAAYGATGIDPATGVSNWHPDTPNGHFTYAARFVQLASAALKAQDKTVADVVVLWMQGEKDATVSEATADGYQSNLANLIQRARMPVGAGWGAGRFIMGRIFDPPKFARYRETVRAAQAAVASRDPNIDLCDLDQVLALDPADGGLHAGPRGLTYMGDRFYDAWKDRAHPHR